MLMEEKGAKTGFGAIRKALMNAAPSERNGDLKLFFAQIFLELALSSCP